MSEPRYWHGGAPDHHAGDRITPGDGIAVEVTTNKDLARMSAHMHYETTGERGALYRVTPHEPLAPIGAGAITYCPAATVTAVYDPVVIARRSELRRWLGMAWAKPMTTPKEET